MGEVKPPTEGLPKARSKVDMENDAMSDEGIGDPMLRASEAWHCELRMRSRGSATRPSGSYQKGTVGMEASSDVLLVNVCVRRVDEAVATSIQELYQKELSGAARA